MCLRLSRFAGGSFCWWLATSRRNATGKLLITWSVYRSSSWILSAKKLTHGLRLVLSSSPCYFQLLRLWVDAWVRRVGYTSHTGSFFSTPALSLPRLDGDLCKCLSTHYAASRQLVCSACNLKSVSSNFS